jgi:hypothetical protein
MANEMHVKTVAVLQRASIVNGRKPSPISSKTLSDSPKMVPRKRAGRNPPDTAWQSRLACSSRYDRDTSLLVIHRAFRPGGDQSPVVACHNRASKTGEDDVHVGYMEKIPFWKRYWRTRASFSSRRCFRKNANVIFPKPEHARLAQSNHPGAKSRAISCYTWALSMPSSRRADSVRDGRDFRHCS